MASETHTDSGPPSLETSTEARIHPERVSDWPAATEHHSTSRQHLTVAAFVLASFLGSALLFLIQPMVARLLLPLVGGSPSLWNTSMVFFQAVLLGGYAFAHLSTRRLGMRIHPVMQVVLLGLPLLVLPVAVNPDWRLPPDAPQSLWVLGVLALTVGLPFFVLSTSSPTLQRWFAASGHRTANDPYFLYAAGNVGSVLALLAYPFVIEPFLTVSQQAALWTGIYIAFVASSALAALLVRGKSAVTADHAAADHDNEVIEPARRWRWILWAFVPSALMLGVTRHVATDVASFPLLWIVPLLLYLITFIIAFGKSSPTRTARASKTIRVLAVPLALTFFLLSNLGFQMALHFTWFFFAALLGHSRLSDDRPKPARLTEFYLLVSVGGVLGGIFSALVAPILFNGVYEYPIAIVMALAIVPRIRPAFPAPTQVAGVLTLAALGGALAAQLAGQSTIALTLLAFASLNALLTLKRPEMYAGTIAAILALGLFLTPGNLLTQERSFFGVYRVQVTDGEKVELVSGTTVHGAQAIDPDQALVPWAYYYPTGPLGQTFLSMPERDDVGVIGLGVGAISIYSEPGDRYTYYEIDPLVVELAENAELFTYMRDTPAEVDLVVGDGRLSLEDEDARFDLLIVDAFSSDAIPVHLMTVEAIEQYLDVLEDDGVILLHISNRHFELAPVLGRITDHLDLAGLQQRYEPTPEEEELGSNRSHWVLLARDASDLAWTGDLWEPLPENGPLWTDDYSDILSVLDL